MTENELISELKKLNIDLNKEQLNQLAEYASFLLKYNKHTNLTAIKTKEEVYLKHFYDSITLTKISDLRKGKLLDVGTGAGFPGLVLAIIYPELQVTLLDSNNKKINFLIEMISKLNLKNVNTIYSRAEDYTKCHREEYDFVTSRAVAELRILLELNIPAIKENGYFLAMKSNVKEELETSKSAFSKLACQIEKILEFELPKEAGHRTIIKIKKIAPTDLKYPRNYDKIKKNSL